MKHAAHAQTFRTLNKTSSSSGLLLGALVVLLIVFLCGATLVFSWPANMEADYIGFGLLGAFAPVIAIIGAFFLGVAVTLSLKSE